MTGFRNEAGHFVYNQAHQITSKYLVEIWR